MSTTPFLLLTLLLGSIYLAACTPGSVVDDLFSSDMTVVTVSPGDHYRLGGDLSFNLDDEFNHTQAKMALWRADDTPAVIISEDDAFKFFNEELAVLAELMFRSPIDSLRVPQINTANNKPGCQRGEPGKEDGIYGGGHDVFTFDKMKNAGLLSDCLQ